MLPGDDGISPYSTNPADELTRLEEAKPPYDAVDAILVTYWHEDHFSPRRWRTLEHHVQGECCPALPGVALEKRACRRSLAVGGACRAVA